ncbi:dermokine [Rhynchonycteris naso]
MKLQGSLACLLLALYLGSGEAGPLLSGGASAEAGIGEAIGHGVGDAISHGIEKASPGIREVMGPGVRDALSHRVGEAVRQGVDEAAHALGNTGSEYGRQTENIIRHGIDAAHNSWQGMPGNGDAWGTNGQPPSGGHGTFGSQSGFGAHSQGYPEGPGAPWNHGPYGGSEGSFGTNSQGSSWGQGGNGGPYNLGPNAQGAVAQPGYGSVRGNSNPNTECINPPPSGSGGSSSNSWGSNGGSGSSGGGSGSSGGGSGSGSGGGGSGSSGSGSSGSGSSGSSGSGSSGSGSGSSGSSGGGSGGGRGSSSGSSYGSGSNNGSGGSSGNGSGGSGGGGSGGSGSSGSSSGGNWEHNASSSSGSTGGSSGGNKPECDNPGNEVRVSGGSGGQGFRGPRGPSSSGDIREISKEGNRLTGGAQGNYQGQGFRGEGEDVNGINNLNSQPHTELFNFDTFWKNLKSKLGFINWDAINKGQGPAPSTRALLYFSRLWEDFKHNTPFLNWKAIIEGPNPSSSLQKRAGGAGQPGAGWPDVPAVTSKNYNYNQQAHPSASGGQNSAKIPAKGGVTVVSSASRAQPGLLQWVKFW